MFDKNSFSGAERWLAFELNVLRRLKFSSIIFPLGGETKLGANLKRWNIAVQTNNLLQSDLIYSQAAIENNFALTAEEIQIILEDAYIPRFELKNSALKKWFNESDAWWFDNVRQNIEKLSSAAVRSSALKIAMDVGDYALSFSPQTRELRQPFSKIFHNLCLIEPKGFDNQQKNSSFEKPLNDFVAESYTDLMFLRLPTPRRTSLKEFYAAAAWREEWIRGNADFWLDLETVCEKNLLARIQTKTQYLKFLENILQTASHIPHWAIACVENNFTNIQEITETVNSVRRVETIFTKDFSELTGQKTTIISA